MQRYWLLLFTFLVSGSFANEINLHDYQDRLVSIKSPAKRIISLSPHITENLFSINAGSQIVATVEFSDFPQAAQKIPRIGGYNMSSVEALVAYQPDLVIFWGSGNSLAVLKQLQRLNIPVYIDEPSSLEDVARSLRDFGRLSGNEQSANAEAVHYLTQLDKLRQKYLQRKRRGVFYQIWHDPIQTLNGKHISSDLIYLCGGVNIFAEESVLAPVVSKESIINLDPDIILASGIKDERPSWLDDWQDFSKLKAVKTNNLLHISADITQRHTMRLLDGAEKLCAMF